MKVDSYKYLTPLIKRYYRMSRVETEPDIPWTPVTRPLSECYFSLVTSGGLYHKPSDLPFDLDRERREPTWGDPGFRMLPSAMAVEDLGVSHLHIRQDHVLADMNILLPIQRFHELTAEGRVAGLTEHLYSFMGYQGFPADLSGWRDTYGPQVARQLRAEGADCVLLTAA